MEIFEFMWGCSWGWIEGTLIRLGISWGCVVSLGAARWGLVQIGLVEVETNTYNQSNKDSSYPEKREVSVKRFRTNVLVPSLLVT